MRYKRKASKDDEDTPRDSTSLSRCHRNLISVDECKTSWPSEFHPSRRISHCGLFRRVHGRAARPRAAGGRVMFPDRPSQAPQFIFGDGDTHGDDASSRDSTQHELFCCSTVHALCWLVFSSGLVVGICIGAVVSVVLSSGCLRSRPVQSETNRGAR